MEYDCTTEGIGIEAGAMKLETMAEERASVAEKARLIERDYPQGSVTDPLSTRWTLSLLRDFDMLRTLLADAVVALSPFAGLTKGLDVLADSDRTSETISVGDLRSARLVVIRIKSVLAGESDGTSDRLRAITDLKLETTAEERARWVLHNDHPAWRDEGRLARDVDRLLALVGEKSPLPEEVEAMAFEWNAERQRWMWSSSTDKDGRYLIWWTGDGATMDDTPTFIGEHHLCQKFIDEKCAVALLRRWPQSQTAGWRPIGSAPKDGFDLLLGHWGTRYDTGGGHWHWFSRGHWSARFNNWNDGIEPAGLADPTHWQPLPAPPATEPAEKQKGGDPHRTPQGDELMPASGHSSLRRADPRDGGEGEPGWVKGETP